MSPSADSFEFIARHRVREHPDFLFEIDQYRRTDGVEFLLTHIRVDRFAPSVLKQMIREWRQLRSIITAPMFACAEHEDDKWVRFVTHMGFKPLQEVICNNGVTRRLFISVLDNHERLPETRNTNPDGSADQSLGSAGFGTLSGV